MKRVVDLCPALRFIPYYKRMIDSATEAFKFQIDYIDSKIHEAMSSSEESFIQHFTEREGAHYDREELCHILRDLFSAGEDV